MSDDKPGEPIAAKTNNLVGILSTAAVVLILVALLYLGGRMG